jgi:hypothetical protein
MPQHQKIRAARVIVGFGLGIVIVFSIGFARWAKGTESCCETAFVVPQHIDLRAILRGYLGWRSTHLSGVALRPAWREYAMRYGVVPESGIGSEDHCVTLTRSWQYVMVERTMSLRLCSVSRGTLVTVNQAVYLRR